MVLFARGCVKAMFDYCAQYTPSIGMFLIPVTTLSAGVNGGRSIKFPRTIFREHHRSSCDIEKFDTA